jgi:2-iminobutanoate/2-iminopropanoate deaminase
VIEERDSHTAEGAPEAIGPYSHATVYNDTLWCSGQIPLDPDSGELVGGTVAEQAEQCLKNLERVCEEAGTSIKHAMKVTIYTTKLDDFAELNDVYDGFVGDDPPARAVVGVAALPKGALVEVDAIVAMA